MRLFKLTTALVAKGLTIRTLDIIPETNGVLAALSSDGRLWKLKPLQVLLLSLRPFVRASAMSEMTD